MAENLPALTNSTEVTIQDPGVLPVCKLASIPAGDMPLTNTEVAVVENELEQNHFMFCRLAHLWSATDLDDVDQSLRLMGATVEMQRVRRNILLMPTSNANTPAKKGQGIIYPID